MSGKRVLLLHGGWEGHQPEQMAAFAEQTLLADFSVTRSPDLSLLTDDALTAFDIVVPIWTFGDITPAQEQSLLRAVQRGLGVVAWHGATSAFLASRALKFLLGGQFVAHPGDLDVTYRVRFLGNDPLVDGLSDFSITSEQYYLLVDPAVKVIARTTMCCADLAWVAGVDMPVAWTRLWGEGRVFYCSLGHAPQDLALPAVRTLLRRAAQWAARSLAADHPPERRSTMVGQRAPSA